MVFRCCSNLVRFVMLRCSRIQRFARVNAVRSSPISSRSGRSVVAEGVCTLPSLRSDYLPEQHIPPCAVRGRRLSTPFSHQPLQSIRPFAAAGRKKAETGPSLLEDDDSSSVVIPTRPEVIGERLIPILNRLQTVMGVVGTSIDLPQLVVVGGQSSGKSSVLENLVGKDFLPRGSGIVTRRPLVLQLIQAEEGTTPYGVFEHNKEKKFQDFGQIRTEIETETERKTGKGKMVSSDPIILKVYSPDVLNLTLVDTPGIARVPVADQPQNIESQIRRLVMNYITPKSAIILAVHAANQDLATSDGIKIAREVDPMGERTIGVITKIDLMDRGSDAMDMLTGRLVPMSLGYVGIVNRSQRDIEGRKSIEMALSDEREFFINHPTYSRIAAQCGTRYLSLKCSRLLTNHIRDCLPDLKREVQSRLSQVKNDLYSLGDSPPSGKSDKKWMLLQILSKYSSDFQDAVEGTRAKVNATELHGGARIRYIFDDVYRRRLAALDPTRGISVEQFRTAIRNAAGPRPSLFVPEGAFEVLVKQQIEKLKEPSLQCADLILGELNRIAQRLEQKELSRFQNMRDKAVEVAQDVFRKNLSPTQRMISDIIDCELAYINTNHSDFIGGPHGSLLREGIRKRPDEQTPLTRPSTPKKKTGLFGSLFGGGSSDQGTDAESHHISQEEMKQAMQLDPNVGLNSELTSREQIQIDLIKDLLSSYFDIARKNVQDSVIKAIWHFLVSKSINQMHKSLITELYQEGDLEKLLKESNLVKEKRDILRAEYEALKEAKKILRMQESEIPEFPSNLDA